VTRRGPEAGGDRNRVSPVFLISHGTLGTGTNPVPGPPKQKRGRIRTTQANLSECWAEELAGVGGQRLDVPPLPLGVERVERERRFPGAGDARDDDELVPGDRDADIFEVVRAGTFDDDIFHFT